MKYLLDNKKLIFTFTPNSVACYTTNYYYQSNGILSFAILDLAYKIIKQQKRKCIVLKKRKPIIHLLNYVDILNFNSKAFSIRLFSKNKYLRQLAHCLYHYRSKYFKLNSLLDTKDMLDVFERENLCIIRFDDYFARVQPQNDLVAMLIYIFEKVVGKEKRDEIDVSGVISYCTLLA